MYVFYVCFIICSVQILSVELIQINNTYSMKKHAPLFVNINKCNTLGNCPRKNVAVVMADTRSLGKSTVALQTYERLTSEINQLYSKKVGYTFKSYLLANNIISPKGNYRNPSWGKLLVINETLRNFDCVLYIDSDAYVHDFKIQLGRLPSTALTVWADERGPNLGNAGVQLWRRGKEATRLLEAWWNAPSKSDNSNLFEQTVLHDTIQRHFLKHITILPSAGFLKDNRSTYNKKIAGWRSDVSIENTAPSPFIVHMWGKIKNHKFALDILNGNLKKLYASEDVVHA